ncbi:hypothetical protein C0Q70_09319 [Pomacea canaliculata]|uniref:Uncharacterized protein n=1 Tax=Pomacea canaliculata TaxID=400727 RepID=A0A2T7P9G4_POMCA|nr:hypothetical protein C0Q70_09319 [Pomacea canaliculata]
MQSYCAHLDFNPATPRPSGKTLISLVTSSGEPRGATLASLQRTAASWAMFQLPCFVIIVTCLIAVADDTRSALTLCGFSREVEEKEPFRLPTCVLEKCHVAGTGQPIPTDAVDPSTEGALWRWASCDLQAAIFALTSRFGKRMLLADSGATGPDNECF